MDAETKPLLFDGQTAEQQLASLKIQYAAVREERDRYYSLLNTPEIHDFAKAVVLEAAHARERWNDVHDADAERWGAAPAPAKRDNDWFWLIGYLAGKALWNPGDGVDVADDRTQLHRIITVAAAACNWHAAKLGQTDMRPGIEPPAGEHAT